MRGVWVTEYTEFKNLVLSDAIPEPVPGPGEVAIRTQAVGISFAMSLRVAGSYQHKAPLPHVPGNELAGIVAAVGPGVTRFAPGDRVCAFVDWGALADVAVAREINTYPIPDSLEFNCAIGFTNSYNTSYGALVWPQYFHLQPGQTLLVHGAAGGVGIAAIEIAKILGATVIATAGGAEKLKVAKAHGADHVIDYRAGPFVEKVLEITGGRGVDCCYDPVGGDVFRDSLRCMAPEGKIMPVGFASGVIPQIPANILLVKNITVCGLNMGYYMGQGREDVRARYEPLLRANMAQLFRWFEQGRIRPLVAQTFPLTQFQDAMKMVLDRKASGRVAVVLAEEAARLGF